MKLQIEKYKRLGIIKELQYEKKKKLLNLTKIVKTQKQCCYNTEHFYVIFLIIAVGAVSPLIAFSISILALLFI